MDLDFEETLEDVGSEDEVQLTPAEVIELMEETWLNEKFAPEILPNKMEIVDCILGQISYMEENLANLDSSDFKKSIHQLEVDRLKFLVTSYLRTRLEKIEMYVFYILRQEAERSEKNQDLYLTENELKYAQNYGKSLEEHLDNVLSFHNGPPPPWKENPITPNMHSFVFLKSKSDVEGVVIDDGASSEESDLVDLVQGSQLIISYNSVANLVKKGDVHLI